MNTLERLADDFERECRHLGAEIGVRGCPGGEGSGSSGPADRYGIAMPAEPVSEGGMRKGYTKPGP